MVGVGLGLSLHSTLPGMVVTEVAAWCQVLLLLLVVVVVVVVVVVSAEL